MLFDTESHCREPKPLIEEVQAPCAASAETPSQAEVTALSSSTTVQPQHASSKPTSTSAAPTGLKGGFLNRNTKPKKSILKKTEAVAVEYEQHVKQAAQRPSGPTVARQLLQQEDPSASSTRQGAFNGCVRERDSATQVWVLSSVFFFSCICNCTCPQCIHHCGVPLHMSQRW